MSIPLSIRRKVFVRGVNWVGDAIIATPALSLIRRSFEGSHITLMVRPWVAPVYENNPDIDELWVEDDAKSTTAFLKAVKRVREAHFDFGIALPNSFRSALLMALGGIKHRVGHAVSKRSALLTKAVEIPPDLLKTHQVHYYRNIVEWVSDERPGPPALVLNPGEKEKNDIESLLCDKGIDSGRMWIGIAPGAINSDAKRWLPERFAALAERFHHEAKAEVILLGSRKERKVLDEVEALCETPLYNLGGEIDLGQLVALVDRLDAFIGNDSGAMHVAAALHVPSVAIFGPTDWTTTAPFSALSKIVRHPVACSPCMFRQCPIEHPCMTGVSVDDVVKSFASLADAIKNRMKRNFN